MEPRQEQQVEEQEEDMFFNAGRAANYAEQYAPSQRLKDTLLKSSATSNNHHHDDINLQKQLNKQQQQSQSIQQYQTPQIATTTPIRTMNNSNNINNNTNTSNNSNTAMINNITNNNPTINRNLPSTTSYNNSSIPTTESRLPTLPSLPSSILNSSSSANTASSTSNNEKALPILSSPGVVGVLTSDQKRKISLQYLAEISNFSRKDVQDAMVSKIDNESGEIYGNIPDIVVGMKYSSRMDLLDSKIHTDLQSDICTNGNYIKPVPAVIMHDTQERHEDRGTVVLYSIPFNGHHSDINTAPSIKGTPCEALAQNSIYKIPVRVVRGSYESSVDDGKRFRNGHCPTQGYRYDGIYFVGEYFYEPGASSFVFKLIRIYGQPELPHAPNLAEPPANRNNNQRPPNSQQGPPSNMPNMPNDRKIFGIPSFVTQRILSGSNQDYLAQSTRNSHNMPYIPSLPQNYSHSNNYNSQTNNPQNPHSLPAMPAMPNMNYNRNNFPNNNNSNMNNNYNEPPPQNNRQVMRGNNQSSSQSSFGSQSFPNNNNNNTNTNNNTTTGSTNNDGLNLSHTSVRQMINNLKFQNSNFGGRIQSYSYNISELATKVEDVQKTMPALGRQLTSRNKTFTWKLGQEKEQEEYDRTKYFVYDDEEDGSEDEDVEIERPSRSKKKKTHHIGSSSSGNISSGNNSVRTTPNDSNSTNSSSKSNNKQ